ncbi:MAG TPA: cobalamin-independent methionine synthase II family protein [Bryobacteraceae bacterium]|nr:cobalamin-independent methionine synthase II family protein [Bryobacteraceae bacterium]
MIPTHLFPTQVIGSLPRPQAVLELLSRRGSMEPEAFQAAMDDAVRFAIRLQEIAGIDIVSDGEWRRSQYVDEYLDRIGGFEPVRRFEHAGETKYTRVVVRRIEAGDPVFASDAEFLARATDRRTKFALPSPFLIAIRYWNKEYSAGAYPTYEHLMEHLAEILAREARAIAGAGVDIVQIDDPALTYFCDRGLMSGAGTHDERLRRDWDADRQVPAAIAAINHIAEGLNVETHVHCCHSVYKRRADVVGDYKPLMPYLAGLRASRVNLEFAYQQTGDAGDLQLLPEHLNVGMGVVDVRGEKLQSVEEIASLAAAGAEQIGAHRIALNPDCGFAPNSAEPPTIDEAFEKLKRLAAAAAQLRERYAGRGAATSR